MNWTKLIIILLLPLQYVGQDSTSLEQDLGCIVLDSIDGNKVYDLVEKAPQFPGGQSKLYEFLGENITYPTLPKDGPVPSKVYLSFVVKNDGSIANICPIKKIPLIMEKELIESLSKMPNWTPGEQWGKTVHVRYTLPINIHWK